MKTTLPIILTLWALLTGVMFTVTFVIFSEGQLLTPPGQCCVALTIVGWIMTSYHLTLSHRVK